MSVVNYLWDEEEDNVIEEYDDSGVTIAEYDTEPTLYGNITSQFRSGQTSYFHHDGIGSTIAVTDDNGDVIDTRAYSAFGEITESTGTTEFPYQYVGQKGYYRDEETGDCYVRRRVYGPAVGRWTSVDPLAFVDNEYGYATNRPVLLLDPGGQQAEAAQVAPPCDEYCGCCVTRLEIKKASVEKVNVVPHIGDACAMKFVLEIDTEYRSYYETNAPFDLIGCNLEWWERADIPIEGQKKHQWYNQIVEHGDKVTFKEWRERKQTCPGEFPIKITDYVSLKGGLGARFVQNVFFAIKASGFSAANCAQPAERIAYAHAHIVLDRLGNCVDDERYVDLPDDLPRFVGKPPGW